MSRQVRSNKLKPSPLSRRLVRALRAAGFPLPLPDDHYALQGTAPGYWQKSAGAWAWQLFYQEKKEWRPLSLGSSDPASTLRKTSVIESYTAHGDIHVCITTPKKNGSNRTT